MGDDNLIDSTYVKNTYIAIIRAITGNQFITIKKADEPMFDDLAKMLEAKQMEPHDYMQFHFRDYSKKSPKPFYPSANYICSIKAIRQYEIHQKMKNKYVTKDYCIDGDDFFVNKTNKRYPIKQVQGPTSQDPDANFVLVTIEQKEYPVTQDLIDSAEYVLCKFKLKEKIPPIKLLEFIEKHANKT